MLFRETTTPRPISGPTGFNQARPPRLCLLLYAPLLDSQGWPIPSQLWNLRPAAKITTLSWLCPHSDASPQLLGNKTLTVWLVWHASNGIYNSRRSGLDSPLGLEKVPWRRQRNNPPTFQRQEMIENYTATVNSKKPFEPVRKCGAIRAGSLQLSNGGGRERR